MEVIFTSYFCTAPEVQEYNIITGEPVNQHCEDQRVDDSSDVCGKRAQFFEPKETK